MNSQRADDKEMEDYASPACFMHEVDPAYFGLAPPSDGLQGDVQRRRKSERERLINARLAIAAEERLQYAQRIAAGLDRLIGDPTGHVISVYWPFRGEPDLRSWMTDIHNRGGRCALPMVVKRNRPLVFRLWEPGTRLERGVWNIPFPPDGAEVAPDVVIAPVVGFDSAWRRLFRSHPGRPASQTTGHRRRLHMRGHCDDLPPSTRYSYGCDRDGKNALNCATTAAHRN
jgi:hypothetical protein